jgi:hypothetical protein
MTPMKRLLLTAQLICVALATQACFNFQETLSSAPSRFEEQSFVGEWRSAGVASFPTSQSCTDLAWNVSSQSETQISGNFEAVCDGGITLTGTATGVLDGNIQIEAAGTATGFGSTPCHFTLTGTGVLQTDSSIRVDYTVQTCIGTFSGTEIIRR